MDLLKIVMMNKELYRVEMFIVPSRSESKQTGPFQNIGRAEAPG